MKLIALRNQINLIILFFLICNNLIEAGFIRGTWNIVGNVFRGAAWTIEKGFESVVSLVIPEPEPKPEPEPEPESSVYNELLQNPPPPSVPWTQRVPPSMRGPPAAGMPYYAPPKHHFQHHGPYHQNLGYHWNQLITDAEAQHEFQNTQQQNYYPPPASSNIRQQNYYPPSKNSKKQLQNYNPSTNSNTKYQNHHPPANQNTQPSKDRGELALQINKIIEELNTKYGNGNYSYSDEVYIIVRKIYDLLYKPDFDLRNEFAKRLLDDYIREIALVYNKELNTVKNSGNNVNSNENNNGGSSSVNVDNTQHPKNEDKAPAVPSHMEEFNELIFMLEDMETSDVNLIYEYMSSFCSKYYKSRNGKFHYLVETEIYNMGSFIKSEFFEFPGDPSIIEFPGNPSTLELVDYVKDIEKAFYSLPPEEIALSAGFRSSISGLSNIENELRLENLSNDDKTYINGPNTDPGLDLSNILSLDFDIEDFVILTATATASSLVLSTLHSQNGVDENETNNGPFSWLKSLFNFDQSSSKPVEIISSLDPIAPNSESQAIEDKNNSSSWLSNLFDVDYHIEEFKKNSPLYWLYDTLTSEKAPEEPISYLSSQDPISLKKDELVGGSDIKPSSWFSSFFEKYNQQPKEP